jgi:hypothetical protein
MTVEITDRGKAVAKQPTSTFNDPELAILQVLDEEKIAMDEITMSGVVHSSPERVIQRFEHLVQRGLVREV